MLTETQARDLLHQAAETIEVDASAPFATPPSRRGRWLPVVAAAALVLVVVGSITVWRAHQPASVDRPHGQVTIPSTVGYPTRAAVGLLRGAGLDPVVEKQEYSCQDDGRIIGTRPRAGARVEAASSVVLLAADGRLARCPWNSGTVAREEAWTLVDLARGVGSPTFANPVRIGINRQPSVTLSAFDASDPANWPLCSRAEPRCPGSALDVIREAVGTVVNADGSSVQPRLRLLEAAGNARRFTFWIGPDDVDPLSFPRWSVSVRADRSGAVTSLRLDYRGSMQDPQPPPVISGADPFGIARHFIDFADGLAAGLPVDTPVDLYLGHRYVRTLSSARASNREAWSVCRPGYAAATCPFSAINTLREYVDSAGRLRVTTPPTGGDPGFCLAAQGGPPSDTGGNHVIAIEPEQKSCVDTFEIDVYSNDVGQIVAVDLLLGEP